MMERIRKSTLVACKWIYTGLVVFGLLCIGWWMIDKSPVYVVHQISSDKKSYVPGDVAILSVDLEKLRNCSGIVSKTMYGACGLRNTFREPTTLPVGRTTISQQVPIPRDAMYFAICTVRVEIEYSCNPWERLFPKTFYFPVIKFEIRA